MSADNSAASNQDGADMGTNSLTVNDFLHIIFTFMSQLHQLLLLTLLTNGLIVGPPKQSRHEFLTLPSMLMIKPFTLHRGYLDFGYRKASAIPDLS